MSEDIKILVVEDNNDINKLLCDMLRQSEYITKSAYSGTEALIYLKEYDWDMVLLDLMLPGMDGKELLSNIRKSKPMPVIIISAKEEKDIKIETLRMGADDYITKPFDIDEVSARIDSHLRRYKEFSNITLQNLLKYREIKNITIQLNEYNNLESLKKIDATLFDKEIENLAYSINKHIDINIQSQIKQKRLEEEIRKNIANVSHDLRTPLTSIIGYIQMIKKGNLSKEKQMEYIDIAERRAKDLQNLLSDFFEISIIELPDYYIELQNININNILCEVIASFYSSFVDKNITPKIDLPKENIMVIGNEGAIKRVLQNLIVNIIKHSKRDVYISFKKENNKAVLATINRCDDIKEEDIDLIFNRFYKKDDARTNKNGSTGLGLSISKSLMEKMNGEIYAEVHGDLLHIFCKWGLK
ncbi:response regulator [Clostridium botulinum]|nr:response regulator [Clostridium botulinum]MCR1138852.1 response regulator [Clostridium botulinum]NEZ78655.1 response regulator [Clostridium botulinum]NFA16485.1 response regulator [Clostridium botulinum]NFA51881.1 response regulator [Clostridium botulinum]NFA65678.1 response regulator [Clostridium botulinum]